MTTVDAIRMITEKDVISSSYDAVLASLGYEQRARYIPSLLTQTQPRRLALAFNHGRTCSFEKNLRWFQAHGYEVGMLTNDDSQYSKHVAMYLEEVVNTTEGTQPIRLCVDISSMSRFRMASLMDVITSIAEERSFTVDFAYSRAKFTKPVQESFHPSSSGPISWRFRGSPRNVELPQAAVIGIGYEYELAAGVIERLEASDVWSFQAISSDQRYDIEADRANEFLYLVLPPHKRLRYSIESPLDCFVNLESLVYGLSRDFRPVLVPFGAKIFTVCCLFVALLHEPRVAVWRVGISPGSVPMDRIPDGFVVGLQAEFSRANEKTGVLYPSIADGEAIVTPRVLPSKPLESGSAVGPSSIAALVVGPAARTIAAASLIDPSNAAETAVAGQIGSDFQIVGAETRPQKHRPLPLQLQRAIGSEELKDSELGPLVLEMLSQDVELHLANPFNLNWITTGIHMGDFYFTLIRSSPGLQEDFAKVATPILVGIARSLERSADAQRVIVRICERIAQRLGLKVIWPSDPDDTNDLKNSLYRACLDSREVESDEVLIVLQGLPITGPH